jgi:arylsulfatase
MMSHMDIWPTSAALAGLTPPPNGEWKDNEDKPIYFDGIDNSKYITGKAEKSARNSWVYIEGASFLGVRFNEWKFLWTAKDTWLGPELKLGLPAIYNLQMDPGENYDMTFNGAAQPTAGVLKTSPGRYAGSDNGWTAALAEPLVIETIATFKKYPNIPTVPAGATLGMDLPEFIPNVNVAPERELTPTGR